MFNQSSAHASHREGALNAFDINLSDRGKKPTPKDTYYPPECTIPELRGTIQSLYTINQKREKLNKGIKTILQERGYYPKNALNLRYKVRCLNLVAYLVPASDKSPYCLA